MPTPETPQNTEEIKATKQQGRELMQEIQDLIAEGRETDDQEEKDKIKKKAEDKLREINKIRRRLGILRGEIEEKDFDTEQFIGEIRSFMEQTYKKWGWSDEQQSKALENLSNIETLPTEDFVSKLEELKKENKDPKKTEENKSKIGTIIQNQEHTPETIEDIKEKIKVIDPQKELWYEKLKTKLGRIPHTNEVIEETHKQYPDTMLSDLKTFKVLMEYIETGPKNSKEIQDKLGAKNGEWSVYFFPGSAFAYESGYWCCPGSVWVGGGIGRDALGLGRAWGSRCRVVLLKR